MQKIFTLDDLVKKSGVSTRTIRFYIQEGLLQGPDSRGKFAHYSQQHLDRLETIRKLKRLRLPLEEIRHLLNTMTPGEIDQIRQNSDLPDQGIYKKKEGQKLPGPSAGSSALAYIQNLTQAHENIQQFSESQDRTPSTSRQHKTHSASREKNKKTLRPANGAETWQRIILQEGIELHIRQDINLHQETKVKNLIKYIQQHFSNESK